MAELLKNKKAVITGGSRGIGKVVAKLFLENGAEVLLFARNSNELSEAQKELSALGKVEVIAGDVSNVKDVDEVAKKAKSLWGEADILVNAAGIYGPIGPVTEVDPGEWRKVIDVNLIGTFLMIRAIAPLMKTKKIGKIINFSGGGEAAFPNFTGYVASKGGVLRLNETVAAELKDFNIDVNAITPGPVNTKFLDDLLKAGPEKVGKDMYDRSLKQKETGGVPPERGAELCLFLASAASDGISGKMLSAVWDNYPKLPEHLQELMSSDVYTMRRVKPEHRGMKFD
ncbi:MAG: short-chain alcohol dehydrogenase [Parcubacteria group bacterium Gr01-1014_19]|nr:MAG: short-chain alcohol dehydrogenase [Parcubacteria group bacterium Gr01-1014_19]